MFVNDYITLHIVKSRQQELQAEAEQERLAVRAAEKLIRRVRRSARRNRPNR